jgi:hypothetical protein
VCSCDCKSFLIANIITFHERVQHSSTMTRFLEPILVSLQFLYLQTVAKLAINFAFTNTATNIVEQPHFII